MGTGGKIKLEEGTAGGTYVGFKAPDTEVTSDLLWTLPGADGAAGQIMATDGAKTLAWIDTDNAARLAADSTLQANINTEITARTNADTTLQSNINAEITSRTNADTTLQSNINVEITARSDADNAEITARRNATSVNPSGSSSGMYSITGFGRISSPSQSPARGAGSETLDCSTQHIFYKTGRSSAYTLALSNFTEGQTVNIIITSVASGVTPSNWSSGFIWGPAGVPVLSAVASKYDFVTFIKVGGLIFGSALVGMA